MYRMQVLASSLLATLAVAAVPALGRAQTVPPACRPLIEAERRTVTTPNHTFVTEGSGSTTEAHESITVDTVTYIQYRGRWVRSPMGPRAFLAQLDQNLATARTYSCQHVGDETVDGVAAAVYTGHREDENIQADTRVWIARGTGLVLRQVEDLRSGAGGDRRHLVIRYEYTNVRAPAGVN